LIIGRTRVKSVKKVEVVDFILHAKGRHFVSDALSCGKEKVSSELAPSHTLVHTSEHLIYEIYFSMQVAQSGNLND